MRIMPIVSNYYCGPCPKPQAVKGLPHAATTEPIVEKLTSKGFKFFRNVNLIAPNGESKKGMSFIKETKSGEIVSLITDESLSELGYVRANLGYNQRFFLRMG